MDVADLWKTILRVVETYRGSATTAGSALGTTVVDSELATRPSYQGQLVKVLDGPAQGQVRPISSHVTSTLTVPNAFTDVNGAVVQITIGTNFTIISIAGAGGVAPPVSPSIGLWMFGVCDPGMAASTTALSLTNLAGFPNDLFNNEFWVQVIHNANSVGNAPEGEIRRVTDYVGATGAFTCDGFTVNVEANDLVCIFHESILPSEILGRGTLTTSSATVPRDSSRTEGDNYFNGCLLMPTEGADRFQPRLIVDYDGTVAPGTFTLDPNNPLTAAPGLVDYIIIGGQADFVPAADGANNRTAADVVGNKTDTIPAMSAAPGNDSLVRQVKAILERVGATPADPDDSLLTNIGQRDDAATADDLSDVTTTSIQAKVRRALARMSADAFSATIQGGARTELDTMLYQLATYIAALGAAYSATVNPGAVAKSNIEETLEDLGDMLAGTNGIATFPAAAAPANGVSIAEVLRQIYNDITAVNDFLPQVLAVSVTAAANAGVTTVATVGSQPVIIDSIVLHADAAQTANLTSAAVQGGVGQVVTFISAADATQANLNAADKQLGWTGAVRLAVGKTIIVNLVGTGAAAVDLTITITYHSEVAGGVLS